MRDAFCRTLLAHSADPGFVFLTGDLGFQALEPLRDAMGSRFINAGIAEQNMTSVAAGLAKGGLRPWLYSIAPFLYARSFEQIRNDVCAHCFPVVLAGNGGGYGYGVMGSSHHALEDYGVLLTLPNIHAYVPAFDSDVEFLGKHLMTIDHPAYLRLGRSEQPQWFSPPAFAPWRHLLCGGGATIVVVGPLAGGLLDALRESDVKTPDVWLVSELPLRTPPPEFLASVRRSDLLMVVEEHVATGGAGQALASLLLESGTVPRRYTHLRALGYVSGLYGSQRFHRAECGIDRESILRALKRDGKR